MVSARWITAALAALAFGAGGAAPAAAGQAGAGLDAQPRERALSKFNPLVRRGSPPTAGAENPTKDTGAPVAAASQPTPPGPPQGSSDAAAAVAIGPPASPPASPVAVETVASTPAAGQTPLGLSQDAPDKPPSVGVIGGGGQSGKAPRSVAPTPEPSTLLLMGAGLAGLYRLRRRGREDS